MVFQLVRYLLGTTFLGCTLLAASPSLAQTVIVPITGGQFSTGIVDGDTGVTGATALTPYGTMNITNLSLAPFFIKSSISISGLSGNIEDIEIKVRDNFATGTFSNTNGNTVPVKDALTSFDGKFTSGQKVGVQVIDVNGEPFTATNIIGNGNITSGQIELPKDTVGDVSINPNLSPTVTVPITGGQFSGYGRTSSQPLYLDLDSTRFLTPYGTIKLTNFDFQKGDNITYKGLFLAGFLNFMTRSSFAEVGDIITLEGLTNGTFINKNFNSAPTKFTGRFTEVKLDSYNGVTGGTGSGSGDIISGQIELPRNYLGDVSNNSTNIPTYIPNTNNNSNGENQDNGLNLELDYNFFVNTPTYIPDTNNNSDGENQDSGLSLRLDYNLSVNTPTYIPDTNNNSNEENQDNGLKLKLDKNIDGMQSRLGISFEDDTITVSVTPQPQKTARINTSTPPENSPNPITETVPPQPKKTAIINASFPDPKQNLQPESIFRTQEYIYYYSQKYPGIGKESDHLRWTVMKSERESLYPGDLNLRNAEHFFFARWAKNIGGADYLFTVPGSIGVGIYSAVKLYRYTYSKILPDSVIDFKPISYLPKTLYLPNFPTSDSPTIWVKLKLPELPDSVTKIKPLSWLRTTTPSWQEAYWNQRGAWAYNGTDYRDIVCKKNKC